MILECHNLLDVLAALKDASIYDFLSSLLSSPTLTSHPSVQKFNLDLPDILEMLGSHPTMSTSVTQACHKHMMQKYTNEVLCLVSKKNGWHFSAWHTSAEQLEAFSLEAMARELMAQVPLLWDLLGTLLNADLDHERHCMQVEVSLTSTQHCEQGDPPADVIPGNDPDQDDEDEYWVHIDNDITDGSKRQRR